MTFSNLVAAFRTQIRLNIPNDSNVKPYLTPIMKLISLLAVMIGASRVLYELRHVTSNNVVFRQVQTQTSLCSLFLSSEALNDVQSVA